MLAAHTPRTPTTLTANLTLTLADDVSQLCSLKQECNCFCIDIHCTNLKTYFTNAIKDIHEIKEYQNSQHICMLKNIQPGLLNLVSFSAFRIKIEIAIET